MIKPLRHATTSPRTRGALKTLTTASLTLATALLAVTGAGCVKRQQVPDERVLRAVEAESSSGVVAIATTMADSPTHITLCSGRSSPRT